MFGKENKENDSEGGGMLGTAVMSLLTGALFGKMHEFLSDLILNAKGATEAYVRLMVKRLLLILFAFIGLLYVLTGLAQIISDVYGRQGAGEIIVGAALLIVSLFWYLFSGKR